VNIVVIDKRLRENEANIPIANFNYVTVNVKKPNGSKGNMRIISLFYHDSCIIERGTGRYVGYCYVKWFRF